MASIEFLAIIFTGLGLTASVIYYANILQNANKTQKMQLETQHIQLFMQLYEKYSSQEFRKQHSTMINQKWENYDDFMTKYGNENNVEAWASWLSVGAYFNGIGVLVRRGKIDFALVEELLANSVFIAWIRMEPIIMGWRSREDPFSEEGRSTKYPFLNGFEYLFNELKKRDSINR